MGGGPVGLGRGGDLDHDSDEKAWRHLEQHIAWLWPHLSGVAITHRWGGPFSVTMDLTPRSATWAGTAPRSTGWAASGMVWP